MSGPATNFSWLTNQVNDGEIASQGGTVRKYTAGATLLTGDIVYMASDGTVKKSTTAALYAGYLGVVVGGYSYSPDENISDTLDNTVSTGLTAALATEFVLVQSDGIALVTLDNTSDPGVVVGPDASAAGRVSGAVTTFVVGVLIEGGVQGDVVKMLVTNMQGIGTVDAGALSGATLAAGVLASSLTSVGVLTALDVDNININGNTISSTAGTDLLITPLAGQQIVLDGAIIIDAGVVTGVTDMQIGNINIVLNTISSTAGTDLLITPLAGQQLILDTNIIIDAGVVTGVVSISIAADGLILATSTPASAAAAGVAGTITWDTGFLYVCTATNTWERVAIATW